MSSESHHLQCMRANTLQVATLCSRVESRSSKPAPCFDVERRPQSFTFGRRLLLVGRLCAGSATWPRLETWARGRLSARWPSLRGHGFVWRGPPRARFSQTSLSPPLPPFASLLFSAYRRGAIGRRASASVSKRSRASVSQVSPPRLAS